MELNFDLEGQMNDKVVILPLRSYTDNKHSTYCRRLNEALPGEFFPSR